ncbi:hypothetical protein JW933_03410 [candidate division FCPU426 bacterium]|nr:hypothetical protein [candidate division FCPU426 bacterium]
MQQKVLITLMLILAAAVGEKAAMGFERRIGARPMGMGDAFVAIADDINAINYNPAGLAFTEKMAGSLEYANLYPGLDDGLIQENHLVYTQRLEAIGGIGLAWNNRSVFGTYHENEFLLGYARGLDSIPLWAGAAAKLYYLAYTDSDSRSMNDYFAKESGVVQFGLDMGFLYQIIAEKETLPGINAGLMIQNLTESDMGIKAQSREPIETRLGGSIFYQEWDADVDLVYSDSEFQAHAGVEKWWEGKTWGARLGVIGGQGTGLTWTAGGSYTFALTNMSIRVNYAFNYSFGGIQETGGVHRLSLDIYPANVIPGGTGKTQSQPQAEKERKVERVRNYVLKQIQLYFSLQNKIAAMQAKTTNPGLEAAKIKLHEAVGKLVWEQDIIGFIQNIRTAEEEINKLENDFRNHIRLQQ